MNDNPWMNDNVQLCTATIQASAILNYGIRHTLDQSIILWISNPTASRISHYRTRSTKFEVEADTRTKQTELVAPFLTQKQN
jgi:hypothetical protein